MEKIILALHLSVAIALIGLILVQHGKGAEAGASFGSGGSNTLFGSQGSGNFLTRVTAILVAIFFITNLGLGYCVASKHKLKDLDQLIKDLPVTQVQPERDSDDIPLVEPQ